MNFQAFETYFQDLNNEVGNIQGWLDQILDGEGLTDREFGHYEEDLIRLYTQSQPLWLGSKGGEIRQWLELCAPKHFRWFSSILNGLSRTLVHASTRVPKVDTLESLRNTLEEILITIKALWRDDEAPAPKSFQFEGFKILNPDRLSDWAVKQILDTLVYTRALFKKRGMEDLLMDGVNSVELLLTSPSGGAAAAGLYRSSKKQIVLIADNILGDHGTRHDSHRWVDEVFVHEFGHYVHMDYITGEARKFWDGTWAPVDEAEKLDKADHQKMWTLNQNERMRFWKLLGRSRFDPSVVRGKLKSPDREKFVAWMYGAGLLKCNNDCSRTSLTLRGANFRDFFRDPAAWRAKYMADRGLGPNDDDHVSDIRRRDEADYADSLDVGPHTSSGLSQLWRNDPKIRAMFGPMGDPGTAQVEKAKARVTEEWGTPSEYGKTNVREDFAESFVQFIVSPQKMTEKGLYRMKRTLWISGYGNKPVMRLAVKLARRWLRAACPQDPAQRVASAWLAGENH